MNIPIFSQEINDGLAERIQASTSIAYTSPLVKLDHDLALSNELMANFAKANSNLDYNRMDLFPLYSLLVTAGIINLNDDFFLPKEVWAARNTPEEKPLNINHRQLDIVGHITANYPVDEDFKVIADNTPVDSLPSIFHIITSSVIYKLWEDQARQKQIATILHEIENSNPPVHFVSMEVLFADYDYLLTNSLGVIKIIGRNETTASLTKHLRAYGGTGKYENYKISRVLKNLNFSGHGIVSNPANKQSVIFDRNDKFDFSKSKMVYETMLIETNNEESVMADTALANIEKLITDLKTEFGTASLNRIHVLESQIEALKKGVDEHQAHISKHEAEKKALTDQHAGQMNTVTAELNQAKFDFEKLKKDKDEDDKKTEAVKAENEAMKKTLDEYKKASKKTEREKALRKTKVKADAIEQTLETFANLDDATFDAVIKTFAMDDEKEDEEKTEADHGAHPIDGEKVTDDGTKTENVNQFGPTHPKNVMGDPTCADVVASASVEANLNLGVSELEKSVAKVQTDIQKYLSKGKKVKGE